MTSESCKLHNYIFAQSLRVESVLQKCNLSKINIIKKKRFLE